MLRMQIAAVLFLGAAMAHADGEIDKYLGKYTANQVCDSHATTTDVEPHVRQDGEFIIAKFINADGEERAIIVDYPGFSDYDWSSIHFEYKPGREFDGIEVSCEDMAERDLRANFAARRYTLNERPLTADEIADLATTLENEAREGADSRGFENLRAEHDFHGGGNRHVIKIYKYGGDKLFIEYQATNGGIHAGHVHN